MLQVETEYFTQVNTTISITEDQIRGLLFSALEEGSRYWVSKVKFNLADNIDISDFKNGGRYYHQDHCWDPMYLIPFVNGCSLQIITQAIPETKCLLNIASLKKGIVILNKHQTLRPYLSRIYEKNIDSETGDIYLQLCLFGKLLFE